MNVADLSAKAAPGGRPRGGVDRKEQLLSAAASLMIEGDTIEVSLADVASRAGMNVALVKYYFGNKEGMLLALAMRESEKIISEFRALMAMTDLSPLDKLKRHLAGQMTIYFRFPYLDRLLRALLRDAGSESGRIIVDTYIRPVCDAQAELLDQAHRDGLIRRTDPKLFYFASAGACEYLFSARATLKHVFGIDEIDAELARRHAEATADLIIRGLAPHRADSDSL